MSTFPCAIHPAALPSYSEKGGGGKGRFIFAKVSFFSGEEKNLADGGRRKREGDGEIPLPLPPPPDSGEFEWLLSPSLFFPLLLPGKNQVKRSFFPSSFLERRTATESVFRIGMVSQSRIGSWDFRMRTSNVGPGKKVF